MSCLTLTFLLYSFLPQLRDLTGKFILGICSFLTTNYALRLIDVEMFGFKVRQNSVCVVHRASNGPSRRLKFYNYGEGPSPGRKCQLVLLHY